jgi:hypothetical protein
VYSIPPNKSKKTLGDRALLVAATTLCSRLPQNIRESGSINIFKNKLKPSSN